MWRDIIDSSGVGFMLPFMDSIGFHVINDSDFLTWYVCVPFLLTHVPTWLRNVYTPPSKLHIMRVNMM